LLGIAVREVGAEKTKIYSFTSFVRREERKMATMNTNMSGKFAVIRISTRLSLDKLLVVLVSWNV
jgi:hypothetical protein